MTTKLEETLREGGYLVDVTFHKVGTNITISPNVLGVEIAGNEELALFFDHFVKNSQISWLGKRNPLIRKAESIAKSVHKRKIRDSLDGKHYIPKSKLPEFKEFLKKKRTEFFEVRDQLADSYELDVRQFEEKLRFDLLAETVTNPVEREQIIKAIMQKVPKQDELIASFKVEQSYMLFAMTSELMDEEDKEASIESTQMRMKEINGRTMAVVLEKVNTVMIALHEKKHTAKHERIANEAVNELEVRNIFKHATISDMAKELTSIKDDCDLTDYEMFVGKLYKFSKEIGETHQLNLVDSLLTLPQLEFLASAV